MGLKPIPEETIQAVREMVLIDNLSVDLAARKLNISRGAAQNCLNHVRMRGQDAELFKARGLNPTAPASWVSAHAGVAKDNERALDAALKREAYRDLIAPPPRASTGRPKLASDYRHDPHDITAQFFGDPPPGRRALDQKEQNQ